MEKVKILYEKFSYALEKVSEVVAATILGGAALIITVEVITRYFFGKTFGILEEGPRLFLCFAVMPMLGVIYKRGRQINVEILPERLRGRKKTFLMLVIDLAMIAGSSIFLIAGIQGVRALYTSGIRVVGVLDLPQFWLMLSIPLGGGILLLYSFEGMVKDITSLVLRAER